MEDGVLRHWGRKGVGMEFMREPSCKLMKWYEHLAWMITDDILMFYSGPGSVNKVCFSNKCCYCVYI